MEITKVELSYPKKRSYSFKAWAKVTIDDQLIIAGLKLFEIREGETTKRVLKFPERRPSLENTNGQTVVIPIVEVISDEFKTKLEEAVFTEFDARPKKVLQKRFNKNKEE